MHIANPKNVSLAEREPEIIHARNHVMSYID